MRFINRETGVEPDIAPNLSFDGLVDCIHKVTIEPEVFSGHDVMVLTGSHDPTTFGSERRITRGGGPVHIKEGAWLCTRSIVVGPAVIGRYAVIGAGAVVVSDIPDYALAVGVPARVVKFYDHD